MSDAPSVTTFVVEDRLPWPDDAPGLPERGPYDSAVLYDGASQQDCSIRKISPLGVTLQSARQRGTGEAVAIELGTGKRSGGTVAWTGRGEIGVAFNEPVDMLALLNRKLVSQPTERRTMPRVEIRCPVHVKCGAAMIRAALRNISANGLQLASRYQGTQHHGSTVSGPSSGKTAATLGLFSYNPVTTPI